MQTVKDKSEVGFHKLFNLADQVVVLTGAASPVGYAIAQRLGELGATVVLTDTRKNELAQRTGALRLGLPQSVFAPITSELGKRKSVKRVIDFAVNEFGRINHWTNIIAPEDSTFGDDHDDRPWDDTIARLTQDAFTAAWAAAATMEQSEGLHTIINIVLVPTGPLSAAQSTRYRAASAAIKVLTQSLAAELDSQRIRALSIYATPPVPEPADSPWEAVVATVQDTNRSSQAQIAQADGIARRVVFALSDGAVATSGTTLHTGRGV